ncbi:putative uncharacterized protein DDB_G0280071 isoform X1 [Nasonia vitripennis]|uniref:Uncharacterized protein n=1 Tax=Nasonia vitripennis TaxID=7425 RepID=A0A7M7R334_NASVI|nr:putative uncharacterized protein DDB_G0280071 isoform X1 [Nasonia vitripennis]
MFLLYQRKLIFDSLSAVLLSLILFHLAVSGNEVTLPSVQREKIDEAIKIIGDFLRSEKGIEWLAESIKERKSQLTTIDLVINILETPSLEGQVWDAAKVLKEALELKTDSIDLNLNKKGAKSNSSEENWNNAVTDVEDEDDILCLYRKNSHNPQMKKSEDWRKLLDIAPGYTIHSVTDKGSKYLICLKKINITETLTTTLPTSIITTLPNLTEEVQTSKSEINDNFYTMHSRSFNQTASVENKNSTENFDNQTIRRGLNRHHDENTSNSGDDFEEDCSTSEQDESDSDVAQDISLKNVTPLYSGKSINHLPVQSRRGNPLKEELSSRNNSIDKNNNVERSLKDNKLLHPQHHRKKHERNWNGLLEPQKTKRRHKQIRDNIKKSRKSMKTKEDPFTSLESINNKRQQPNEFEFLLQDKPNFQFQMINAIQQTIPFVLYLHKLHSEEKMQLVNNMLDCLFQEKPPCHNVRQQILFPFLPPEDDNRGQFPCMFSENFNQTVTIPYYLKKVILPNNFVGLLQISMLPPITNELKDQVNFVIPLHNSNSLSESNINNNNHPSRIDIKKMQTN